MDRIPAIRRVVLADRSPLAALAWSGVAVAVPTTLRWVIDRGGAGVPFVTYFPAVVLATLLLGWRWGAGVALVSGAIANRLFVGEPLRAYVDAEDAVLVALFALSCAALVWIAEMARRLVREMEAAKARESLLNQELSHRVKNMLATVSAMAVLTARHSGKADFAEALQGRLEALKRATEMLAAGGEAHCDLQRLVDGALAPFRSRANFAVGGPACELPRDACVPLSLALHELATNAVKYGALSVPEGRVELGWTLGAEEQGSDEGLLRLAWREHGGPRVVKPKRTGMGTQLLRRQTGLKSVDLQFPPGGACCLIEVEGASCADPAG